MQVLEENCFKEKEVKQTRKSQRMSAINIGCKNKQTNKTMTTWCGTNETENSEENGTQPKYNLKENNIYTFLYRFFPAGFTEQTNLFWVIIFTGKYRLNIS